MLRPPRCVPQVRASFRENLGCTGALAALELGEDEAKMAKRLDVSPDLPLSPEALAELRQRYAMLSKPSLQQVYADAWERCKPERNGRTPRAEQIQVLVTAWKMLRRAG